MKYILELSEEQLKVVGYALDSYKRIGMGQFGYLDFVEQEGGHSLIRDALYAVEKLANKHYGIRHGNIDDKFRVAYDIEQVIRHAIYRDNCHKFYSVDGNEPTKTSKQDLPKIRIKK